MTPEAVEPDAGWRPVRPFPFPEARQTFTGSSEPDPALKIRYYERPDKRLVAIARFGRKSEGGPGQVHGGGIVAVLDEALGAAAWIEGHPVVTVRLSAEFRKIVPIDSQLLVETEIVKVRSRVVWVRGVLVGGDRDCYARAEAEFLRIDEKQARMLYSTYPSDARWSR